MADAVQWAPGLRAAVFDVNGTLYDPGPVRRAMAMRLLRAHALRPATGYRTARILMAYRRAQEQLRSTREIGDVASVQLQLAAWISNVELDEVRAVVDRWMAVEAMEVLAQQRRPEVAEALAALKTRGVRLGVLSDYPPEWTLDALGLADLFDVVVYAQQPDIGVLRPHPRGLMIALERLGAAPSEAVYVGDRPDVDGALAEAVGVRCVIVGHRRPGPSPVLSIPTFDEIPRRIAAA